MEELRTTEALDREILEDARKKAHRILKAADDTLAAQKSGWDKKTGEALDSIRKTYGDRIKKTGEEILARLPLDKRRLRSEIAEGRLAEAMDGFLRSLKRGTALSILRRELFERLEDCAGEGFSGKDARPVVTYSGLSLDEARALFDSADALSKGKTGSSAGSFAGGIDLDFREDTRAGEFPSLVIDTGAVRISASVENAAAVLLKDRRAELASALLGVGVLDD